MVIVAHEHGCFGELDIYLDRWFPSTGCRYPDKLVFVSRDWIQNGYSHSAIKEMRLRLVGSISICNMQECSIVPYQYAWIEHVYIIVGRPSTLPKPAENAIACSGTLTSGS